MEQLVKLRRSYRGSFTKFTEKIQDFLKTKSEDSDSCAGFLAQLQEKYSRIEGIDKEILLILQGNEKYDEDAFNSEIESTENYNGTFIELKTKLERRLKVADLDESRVEIETSCSKTNFKLPKIEFFKFDGNLKNFLSFWGLFKKIHEDPKISEIDKFQYLLQSTLKGSRAREVVESFPVTAENYEQAIDCLRARFGREDVLIEVYVRELLSLVLSNVLGQEHKLPIVKLYDRIETQLRSLKMLGVTSDKYASMLYPLVESCLPVDLLRVWERHLNSFSVKSENKDFNKLEILMQFLRNEIEGEEKVNLATSGFGCETKTKGIFKGKVKNLTQNKTVPTGMELLTSCRDVSVRQQRCIFCDKPHQSTDCNRAEGLTYDQKKQILIKKGGCFKCLKLNHISATCRARCVCTICGGSHNFLLCRNNYKIQSSIPSNQKNETITTQSEQTLANISSSPCVLLQTLVVLLRGEREVLKIRAIFDSASQRSYLLKSTAEKAGYMPMRKESLKHSLFGGSSTDVCEHEVYKAHVSCIDNSYHCNFDVLSQNTICQTLPPVTQETCDDDLSHLGIFLNDCHGPIELLIGADVAGKLMTGGFKRLNSDLTAIETKLGWTILGRTKLNSEETENLVVTSMLTRDVRLTDLWELDCLGIKDPAENQSKNELEEASERYFERTLNRDSDGRYIVSLPWIEGHQALPDNKMIAERRLKSTMKTLQNKGLTEAYEDVFKQWLDEQIIEEVKPCYLNESNCHYLPHRAVVKENSTTKIRPVFDASAKEKNSVSLNDCLSKGTNYIELIPSILNRFRLEKYGVIADIRKAFLQIGIREEDRNFLRFLWWEGGDPGKMKVFRHRRVVFGVNCSPFLLGATLNYHLSNVENHLQNIACKLKKSMYVDNCVTSCKSKEELMHFIKQSKEIMFSAGFDLRGWVYNSEPSEILDVNREDEKISQVTGETLNEEIVSVLGLYWNVAEDTLFCNPKLNDYSGVDLSKRIILSIASQLFDPIGFICPVTLIPKIIMQECWRRKLSWDAKLPNDLEKKFLKWKEKLSFLKDVRIPRKILNNFDEETGLSFHVFCDASQHSYATCIYVRNENCSDVKCHLVQARARVAPLKSVSISRLELLACCIGARLMDIIKKELPFDNFKVFYWSDSMNALHWIKNQENWSVFIINRVKEIRSLSNPDDWNHVPGCLNPADLPSRGCNADVLSKSFWWEGPQFLKASIDEWPRQRVSPDLEIVNSEKKRSVISALNTGKQEKFYERYSSYMKILKIIAWIYRFVSNVKNRSCRISGELTLKEIKHAEVVLLKIVQKEEFSKGVNDRIRQLHPLIDKDGLLRVKTLIFRSKDSDDFRLPIILPGDHYVTQKLIEWKHRELNHAGVQILMNNLREKYWILRSRKSIRKVTLRCSRCRRFIANSIQPESPPLPEDRIRDAAPFEVTGVDLAGPLYLRDKQKCWIVLYTCAVYRAIHLELLTSLSSDAFLQTFRRFVARRGRPFIIYSDNGSNFCGASNLFTDPEFAKIRNEAQIKNITWKFIPPASPWWGGWWERLVGCVKQILRKVLGQASLNFEELNTVICDIEGLINSRPLTTLTEDTNDLIPLTPNMFLQGLSENGLPDLDHLEKVNLKKRLRYMQKLKQDLRKRFRIEYLGQLKETNKVSKDHKPIAVGEVVLVGQDNQKRISWPLARVMEIYPSKDGLVRVVKIKTKSGFLIRPVQRLYRLEIASEERDTSQNQCPTNAEELAKVAFQRLPGKTARPNATKETCVPLKDDEMPRVTRKGRIIRAPKRLDL